MRPPQAGPHPRAPAAAAAGQDIIPSGRSLGINNNTFDVSNGDVPAAGPLGRSMKYKGRDSLDS